MAMKDSQNLDYSILISIITFVFRIFYKKELFALRKFNNLLFSISKKDGNGKTI
jgi:hypothetical protein